MAAISSASEKGVLGPDDLGEILSIDVPKLASEEALDDVYQTYKSAALEDVSPEDERRVLRKIDLRVVPILFGTYLLQYLDKNSLNFASVYGLKKATHLKGQDYSWLGSIFYFGYLIAQFPGSYLLQRLPIGKVVSIVTILWGGIVMTTPGCSSFAGMSVNRFFLGVTEAVVNPAFVLIMSTWYTATEQPLRLESYYCTNGIATMFGGLIGYAVGHISTGLPKWMYVFLIFGSASVAWGVVSLLVLPDLPSTARFLNERERAIAINRVSQNKQGVKNHHFRSYQAVQCAKDPKTWILFVMAVGAQIPNSALTSFTSIIVGTFGFDTLGTQYMQIPGGAVQFLALIIGGWVCTRWSNLRCITMIVANTICIIGAAMLVGLPNDSKWGRLVGLWLCYFQGLGFSISLTMVSSNVAGYTKKQLTGAVLFTGYCVGNIIGPQTFKSSEAPHYHSAYIAMLVGYTVKLVMVIVLYIYMYRSNKARDAASVSDDSTAVEMGMLDQTELDNKGFRLYLAEDSTPA
ncbi:allantoate permease [Grosmannia clavigera kw1407]|uniref:Allantoate permease n=1 Tax=Grosmannia clavigera (strain kw1407 / UAMH 11150) TaxID=655863 RepID=F0XKQ0_GROCL|nr:allantoate permease [Grosmannia clavigera kw1407]EFX01741.1 allantoate permease [Grosmannia clavigera kw1407]